jgi:hypothetical protein
MYIWRLSLNVEVIQSGIGQEDNLESCLKIVEETVGHLF